MSETGRIIIAVCILVLVYLLARRYQTWRIKNAYVTILRDLDEKKAYGPESAVVLPYAGATILQMGTRDFRPRALEYLVLSNVVGIAESGKYYLKNKKVAALNLK